MTTLLTAVHTNSTSSTIKTYAVVCDNNGYVLYSTNVVNYIYRSTDNGVTYKAVSVPNAGNIYFCGCCSPVDNTLYFFSTSSIIKSTDSGLTWTKVSTVTATQPYSCICDNKGYVYVSCDSGIIYYTTNAWSTYGYHRNAYMMYCMTLDTVNNKIYGVTQATSVSSTDGVYTISSTGVATVATTGLTTGMYVYSIVYLSGYLYVCGYYSGAYYFFRTSVSAISWASFITPNINLNGFCIANKSNNTIIATNQNTGYFEIKPDGTYTISAGGSNCYVYTAAYNPVDGCIYSANQGSAAGATQMFRFGVCIPKASPVAGTYSATQSVVLTSATSSVTIYYTTDGTTPTTSSSVYSGAVSISSTETLKAIAVVTNYTASGIFSGLYTINSKTIHVGSGGTWHTVTASYVGSGGVWKIASVVDAGSGGVWK